jgi:hypothetical protein
LLKIDVSGLVDEVGDLGEERSVFGVELETVVETTEQLICSGLG